MAHSHQAALPWAAPSASYGVGSYASAPAVAAPPAPPRRGRPPKSATSGGSGAASARGKRKASQPRAPSAGTTGTSFSPTTQAVVPAPVGEVLNALAGAVALTASMLAAVPAAVSVPEAVSEESGRTKPGRKPLNDVPATRRTAQNRASQRAFRERRQAHLADLEGKVKRYEAERTAVASQLSVLAQRVRDETPRVHALEAALVARDNEIAQWHARCSDLSRALDAVQAAVRSSSEHHVANDSWSHRSSSTSSASRSSIPTTVAAGPSVPKTHRPDGISPPSSSSPSALSGSSRATSNARPKEPTPPRAVTAITMPTGGAGVWTTLPPLGSTPTSEMEKWCGGCVKGGECACRGDGIIDFDAGAGSGSASAAGTGNGSTAAAVALPLRRRSPKSTKLWSVHASVAVSDATPTPSTECSGDPRTCGACGTDPGLAAFCEAVNEDDEAARASQHRTMPTRPPSPSGLGEGEAEASVPEAWRQLRSHPHFASFTRHDHGPHHVHSHGSGHGHGHDRAGAGAGLHLLADVVAGRDALPPHTGANPAASPEPSSRKRRRIHVDRDGIRNALALLDRGAWAAGREVTPPSPASPPSAHSSKSPL